jgi:hypothetical protein
VVECGCSSVSGRGMGPVSAAACYASVFPVASGHVYLFPVSLGSQSVLPPILVFL